VLRAAVTDDAVEVQREDRGNAHGPRLYVAEQRAVLRIHGSVEGDQRDALGIRARRQVPPELAERDAAGAWHREAIDATADRRERDVHEPPLDRQRQCRAIAGRQDVVLALLTASPDGADRVD